MTEALRLSGSYLPQQQDTREDLYLDDEFTLEELSLVQGLLPPERFLRVLTALRTTLATRASSHNFTTPVKQQLQPLPSDFLSPSTLSQPTGGAQHASDSSDDEEIVMPPRQFATAAAEFRYKLSQAAKPARGAQHGEDEEEDMAIPAMAGDKEQGEHKASKAAGQHPQQMTNDRPDRDNDDDDDDEQQDGAGFSPEHRQSGGTKAEVWPGQGSHKEDAGQHFQSRETDSRNVQSRGQLPDLAPTWASGYGLARDSQREQLQRGRSVAEPIPSANPSSKSKATSSPWQKQAVPSDTDSDEEEQNAHAHISDAHAQGQPDMSHDELPQRQNSRAAVTAMRLQSSGSVDRFLARLHQPHGPQPQLQPDLAKSSWSKSTQPRLPSQSHSRTLHQQQKQVPALQTDQMASAPLQPAARAAAIRRQSLHSDAEHSVLSEGSESVEPAKIGVSPLQASVAAVAGRLQSVQQGLAGAEGRLAQLTGRWDPPRQSAFEKHHGTALQHESKIMASRPSNIADIIRRFDSSSAQGSPMQSPASQNSPQRGQASPRISALTPSQPEVQEVQISSEASSSHDWEAESSVTHVPASAADIVDPDEDGDVSFSQQSMLEGQTSVHKSILDLPQLSGGGSLGLPQLQGQSSSMRGDLWLPQQWLEAVEQLPEADAAVTSPRDKMYAAMEAVRAAETAVDAATLFSPSRSKQLKASPRPPS